MAKWKHVQTYQGYPIQSLRFRRSPGLEADYGEVVLSYEDLKKISVEIRAVPWDTVGGVALPSPSSIKGSSKVARPTVGASGGDGGGAGGGLKAYGTLSLSSYLDGSATSNELIYKGIYVGTEGIEEIDTKLAGAREHNVGRVRVPITDIRRFWKYGGFLERINCRLRGSGNWDTRTTKSGQTPWTAQEVFRHMFGMLPGSPAISGGDLFKDSFEPPDDLVGDGEPIRQVVRRLLDRYGLECFLQPDNSVVVSRRANPDIKYGTYFESQGSPTGVQHVKEEKKTVWITERPAAVMVVGRRKVKRIAVGYVPCIQDPEDGKIYKLAARMRNWGYSIDKVNKEVLSGREKSFRDIFPVNERRGYLRAKAVREWAYRGYAPAHAFGPDGSYDLENMDPVYGLPMVSAPWTKDEIKKLGGGGIVKNGLAKKVDDFALLGPVVYAARYGQGFFTDFEAMKDDFKAMQSSYKERIKYTESLIARSQYELSGQIDIAKNAQEAIGKLSTGEARSRYGRNLQRLGVSNGQDLMVAAAEFLGSELTQGVYDAMYSNVVSAGARGKQLSGGIAALREVLSAEKSAGQKWQAKFDQFKKIYEKLGGIQVWMTLPHGPVPPGAYSLDTETGILRFSDLACITEEPYMLQREGAKVAGAGSVSVVYGMEVNDGLPSDFTSVLMAATGGASEAGGAGTGSAGSQVGGAAVCALGRGSSLAPMMEKDPNLVLYLNEVGEPHNVTAVASAAMSRGAGALMVPAGVTGWEYTMQGHRKAVLESGVSQIQHEFNGTKASTYVAINAPGGRGPLGPVHIGVKGDSGLVVAAETALKATED